MKQGENESRGRFFFSPIEITFIFQFEKKLPVSVASLIVEKIMRKN